MPIKEPCVRVFDTTVGVSEERVDKESLKRRAMIPLLKFMGQRGWEIGLDPETHRRYRSLSKWTRRSLKGELHGLIRLRGRCLDIELWQERYNITHPNGGRYEHNRREKMPVDLRRRCDFEMAKIAAFLRDTLQYPVDDQRFLNETADEFIARDYAENWHTDKSIGRPACRYEHNRRSANGTLLEQGQVVWLRSYSGRWLRGQAFYCLNNTWFVKLSQQEVRSVVCSELFTTPPVNPRDKRHPRSRQRMQQALSDAVKDCRFLRAHAIHSAMQVAQFPNQVEAR